MYEKCGFFFKELATDNSYGFPTTGFTFYTPGTSKAHSTSKEI